MHLCSSLYSSRAVLWAPPSHHWGSMGHVNPSPPPHLHFLIPSISCALPLLEPKLTFAYQVSMFVRTWSIMYREKAHQDLARTSAPFVDYCYLVGGLVGWLVAFLFHFSFIVPPPPFCLAPFSAISSSSEVCPDHAILPSFPELHTESGRSPDQ